MIVYIMWFLHVLLSICSHPCWIWVGRIFFLSHFVIPTRYYLERISWFFLFPPAGDRMVILSIKKCFLYRLFGNTYLQQGKVEIFTFCQVSVSNLHVFSNSNQNTWKVSPDFSLLFGGILPIGRFSLNPQSEKRSEWFFVYLFTWHLICQPYLRW